MATFGLSNVFSTSSSVNLKKSHSSLSPSEDLFSSFPVQNCYLSSNSIESKPLCTSKKKESPLKSTVFGRDSSFPGSISLGRHGRSFSSLSQFPNPKTDKKKFSPKTVITSRQREFIPKAQSAPVTEIVTETVPENRTENSTETVPEHVAETVDMEQEGEERTETETETEKFVWEKNWYPVALIEDLPVSKPTPFQLLGINMVLWRDAGGKWRAFGDSCPHRLAPLSEGRVTPSGLLQCSYHGWAFSGSGTCQLLPQAQSEGPEARAREGPRACAQTFPTREGGGLLWVWPDKEGREEAERRETPRLPAVFDDPSYSTVTIQRDLFYGYDILMENVADPSHINFAHHKVTGRRDRARPLPFIVEKSGPNGFMGSSQGNPKISSSFQAPTYFENKLDLKVTLPILGEQNWEIWICSFNVPMAPGKTRSIVCSARNFSKLTSPGKNWWQVYPRWFEHLTSNLIYDGDMLVLKGQESVLFRNGKAGKQIPYSRATFTPTGADRFVLAFRNWLRRYGGGEPKWEEGVKGEGMELPSTRMSKREMLDRLSQHTEICSSCNGALKGVKKLAFFFGSLAVLLLAAATLPSEFSRRLFFAGGAVFSAGICAWLKLYLEQQFIFVDYNHSDIPD